MTQPRWGRRRKYRAKEFLWLEHEVVDQVCLLEKGRVHVVSLAEDGSERVLQVVQAGEMFGELCLCPQRSAPHGVNARAIVPSEVLEAKVGGESMRQGLLADAAFSAKLIESFCARLSHAENRLRILGLPDGRMRIQEALLYFARTRGRWASDGGLVSLTLSHAELAEFTCMTRPYTTVMMTRLRAEGLIGYERGSALSFYVKRLVAG